MSDSEDPYEDKIAAENQIQKRTSLEELFKRLVLNEEQSSGVDAIPSSLASTSLDRIQEFHPSPSSTSKPALSKFDLIKRTLFEINSPRVEESVMPLYFRLKTQLKTLSVDELRAFCETEFLPVQRQNLSAKLGIELVFENPHLSDEERKLAIDLIIDVSTQLEKHLGIVVKWAISRLKYTVSEKMQEGFKRSNITKKGCILSILHKMIEKSESNHFLSVDEKSSTKIVKGLLGDLLTVLRQTETSPLLKSTLEIIQLFSKKYPTLWSKNVKNTLTSMYDLALKTSTEPVNRSLILESCHVLAVNELDSTLFYDKFTDIWFHILDSARSPDYVKRTLDSLAEFIARIFLEVCNSKSVTAKEDSNEWLYDIWNEVVKKTVSLGMEEGLVELIGKIHGLLGAHFAPVRETILGISVRKLQTIENSKSKEACSSIVVALLRDFHDDNLAATMINTVQEISGKVPRGQFVNSKTLDSALQIIRTVFIEMSSSSKAAVVHQIIRQYLKSANTIHDSLQDYIPISSGRREEEKQFKIDCQKLFSTIAILKVAETESLDAEQLASISAATPGLMVDLLAICEQLTLESRPYSLIELLFSMLDLNDQGCMSALSRLLTTCLQSESLNLKNSALTIVSTHFETVSIDDQKTILNSIICNLNSKLPEQLLQKTWEILAHVTSREILDLDNIMPFFSQSILNHSFGIVSHSVLKLIETINPLSMGFLSPEVDVTRGVFSEAIMKSPPSPNFRQPHFIQVLQYFSGESLHDYVWLKNLFHACDGVQSCGDLAKDEAFFDSTGTPSLYHLRFWACWEAARFCVISRLRSVTGNALATLNMIDDLLVIAEEDLQNPTTHTSFESKSLTFLRVFDLLQFIRMLLQQIDNASLGSSLSSETAKVQSHSIRTFFHKNQAATQDWVQRSRYTRFRLAQTLMKTLTNESLFTLTGMEALILELSSEALTDFINSSKTYNSKEEEEEMMERLENYLTASIRASCILRDADTLLGLRSLMESLLMKIPETSKADFISTSPSFNQIFSAAFFYIHERYDDLHQVVDLDACVGDGSRCNLIRDLCFVNELNYAQSGIKSCEKLQRWCGLADSPEKTYFAMHNTVTEFMHVRSAPSIFSLPVDCGDACIIEQDLRCNFDDNVLLRFKLCPPELHLNELSIKLARRRNCHQTAKDLVSSLSSEITGSFVLYEKAMMDSSPQSCTALITSEVLRNPELNSPKIARRLVTALSKLKTTDVNDCDLIRSWLQAIGSSLPESAPTSSVVDFVFSETIKFFPNDAKLHLKFAHHLYRQGWLVIEQVLSDVSTKEAIQTETAKMSSALLLWSIGETTRIAGFEDVIKEWDKTIDQETVVTVSQVLKSDDSLRKDVLSKRESILSKLFAAASHYASYLSFYSGPKKMDALTSSLRLLRLITKYSKFDASDCLKNAAIKSCATSVLHWKNLLPQVLSRFEFHSQNSSTRFNLSQILKTTIQKYPEQVLLTTFGALLETSNSEVSTFLRETVGLYQLSDKLPIITKFVNGMQQISVLPEDTLMHFLLHLLGDGNRRIDALARLCKGGSDQKNWNEFIDAVKSHYISLIKPIVISIRSFIHDTVEPRLSATSEHDKWVRDTLVEPILKALKPLEEPDWNEVVCEPRKFWNPLRKLILDLQKTLLQSRRLEISSIDPALLESFDNEIYIPGMPDGVFMKSVHSEVHIINTKTRPKQIHFVGSDGNKYKYLLKGTEDLHLDERIMQLLHIISLMMKEKKRLFKRAVPVRYYSVVPLGRQTGLIEWVDNAEPIYSLYRHWQKSESEIIMNNNTDDKIRESSHLALMRPTEQFSVVAKQELARRKLSKRLSRDQWPHDLLHSIFLKLQKVAPTHLIRHELTSGSISQSHAQTRRANFVESLAAMSMIGFILGLGDRHLDNLLIDMQSAEVLHIDYNVCFEKGRRLRIPECVPFRLTQNFQEAFGPFGIDGPFKRTCEYTLSLFRQHKELLMTLLEAFLYDPLTGWQESHVDMGAFKKAELQVNIEIVQNLLDSNREEMKSEIRNLAQLVNTFSDAIKPYQDYLSTMPLLIAESKIRHSNMENLRKSLRSYQQENSELWNALSSNIGRPSTFYLKSLTWIAQFDCKQHEELFDSDFSTGQNTLETFKKELTLLSRIYGDIVAASDIEALISLSASRPISFLPSPEIKITNICEELGQEWKTNEKERFEGLQKCQDAFLAGLQWLAEHRGQFDRIQINEDLIYTEQQNIETNENLIKLSKLFGFAEFGGRITSILRDWDCSGTAKLDFRDTTFSERSEIIHALEVTCNPIVNTDEIMAIIQSLYFWFLKNDKQFIVPFDESFMEWLAALYDFSRKLTQFSETFFRRYYCQLVARLPRDVSQLNELLQSLSGSDISPITLDFIDKNRDLASFFLDLHQSRQTLQDRFNTTLGADGKREPVFTDYNRQLYEIYRSIVLDFKSLLEKELPELRYNHQLNDFSEYIDFAKLCEKEQTSVLIPLLSNLIRNELAEFCLRPLAKFASKTIKKVAKDSSLVFSADNSCGISFVDTVYAYINNQGSVEVVKQIVRQDFLNGYIKFYEEKIKERRNIADQNLQKCIRCVNRLNYASADLIRSVPSIQQEIIKTIQSAIKHSKSLGDLVDDFDGLEVNSDNNEALSATFKEWNGLLQYLLDFEHSRQSRNDFIEKIYAEMLKKCKEASSDLVKLEKKMADTVKYIEDAESEQRSLVEKIKDGSKPESIAKELCEKYSTLEMNWNQRRPFLSKLISVLQKIPKSAPDSSLRADCLFERVSSFMNLWTFIDNEPLKLLKSSALAEQLAFRHDYVATIDILAQLNQSVDDLEENFCAFQDSFDSLIAGFRNIDDQSLDDEKEDIEDDGSLSSLSIENSGEENRQSLSQSKTFSEKNQPAQEKTFERNRVALNILKVVKAKLDGRDELSNSPESSNRAGVSEQVDAIINASIDPNRLCRMYEGWTAWI